MTMELVRGDFDAFFRVPFEVYPASSPYVSMMRSDLKKYLDPKQNPMMKSGGVLEFYVVKRNGRPVARATAHRHLQSNERHGWARTCFGYFDAADDAEAIDLLFTAIEDFAKRHGDTRLATYRQLGTPPGRLLALLARWCRIGGGGAASGGGGVRRRCGGCGAGTWR